MQSFREFNSQPLNIISFKDFVNEAPNAHEGDWDGGKDMTMVDKTVNQNFVDKLILLDTIEGRRYYIKVDKSSAYIIDNDNIVLLQLKMSSFDISVSGVEGLQTNMVKISKRVREGGLTKHLYTLLCNQYNTLICDSDQYDGARALWKSLGKSGFHNYVYDEVKDTLISVKDFNNEKFIWSFNNASKEHILMVISTKELNTSPQY